MSVQSQLDAVNWRCVSLPYLVRSLLLVHTIGSTNGSHFYLVYAGKVTGGYLLATENNHLMMVKSCNLNASDSDFALIG